MDNTSASHNISTMKHAFHSMHILTSELWFPNRQKLSIILEAKCGICRVSNSLITTVKIQQLIKSVCINWVSKNADLTSLCKLSESDSFLWTLARQRRLLSLGVIYANPGGCLVENNWAVTQTHGSNPEADYQNFTCMLALGTLSSGRKNHQEILQKWNV